MFRLERLSRRRSTTLGQRCPGLWRAAFALLLAVLAACSSNHERPASRLGSLLLPLEAEADSGNRYRLRDAQFTITNEAGRIVLHVVTGEHPTATQVRVRLVEGLYEVEISSEHDNFLVDRVNGDGSTTAATNVELVSASVTVVEIQAGREARAVFTFLVDGDPVSFGGHLVITIQVDERTPGEELEAGVVEDSGSDPDASVGVDAGDAGDGGDGGVPGGGDADAGAFCGDGVVNQQSEDCDDGNTDDQDGCTSECVITCVCGDAIVCPLEDCDDGNLVDEDDCPSSCRIEAQAFCGDGIKNQPSEQCDDGNAVEDDACSTACQLTGDPICGDGVVNQQTEECDDKNQVDDDRCSNLCLLTGDPICGDGVVNQESEECDDGNQVDDDACKNDCTLNDTGEPNPGCVGCLDVMVPDNLNQNCTAAAGCAAVRKCVVDSNCFQIGGSDPSECFCGIGADLNACVLPEYVPAGPCANEIRAAFPAGTDNATITAEMAAPGANASGDAFNILINSAIIGLCIEECSLQQ